MPAQFAIGNTGEDRYEGWLSMPLEPRQLREGNTKRRRRTMLIKLWLTGWLIVFALIGWVNY